MVLTRDGSPSPPLHRPSPRFHPGGNSSLAGRHPLFLLHPCFQLFFGKTCISDAETQHLNG